MHIVRTGGSNNFFELWWIQEGWGVKYLVFTSPLRWLIIETWNFVQCFIIISRCAYCQDCPIQLFVFELCWIQKGVEDVKLLEDVYFTAHAFSSTFASTLMEGGFCRSTVYLGSWGRHLFLIKTRDVCETLMRRVHNPLFWAWMETANYWNYSKSKDHNSVKNSSFVP